MLAGPGFCLMIERLQVAAMILQVNPGNEWVSE